MHARPPAPSPEPDAAPPIRRPAAVSALLIAGIVAVSAAIGLWAAPLLAPSSPSQEPIASPEPTQPAVDVEGQDLADLPRYPGAVRVVFRQEVQGSTAVTAISYTATAEIDDVRLHYRQVFREHNWDVIELDFIAGEWTFLVASGNRIALIELEPRAPFVDVEIELEERASAPPATTTPAPTPPPPPPPPGDDDDD